MTASLRATATLALRSPQSRKACENGIASILREAGGRPVMRNRGRPDSTGNVKKADLLRMRAVERMNRLGGRLQQDRAALFHKIRLSFRR